MDLSSQINKRHNKKSNNIPLHMIYRNKTNGKDYYNAHFKNLAENQCIYKPDFGKVL